MPRKGDELLVMFTHILGPNKAFVQIIDDVKFTEFQGFQNSDLQNVKLVKVSHSEAGDLQLLSSVTNIF